MKPILFSTEMIRAILENRKKQTRRIIKPQPNKNDSWSCNDEKYYFSYPDGLEHYSIRSRYGIGDELWVRETWRIGAWRDGGRMAIDYAASPVTRTPWVTIPEDIDPDGEKFNYYWRGICDELQNKKIYPEVTGEYHWESGKAPLSWRPSIFMPRWAARIFLQVTDVRVERLQDISNANAKSEGADFWFSAHDGIKEHDYGTEYSGEYCPEEKRNYIKGFQILWDKLNAKRGYGWESNPWVFVIEFERIER